MNARRLVLPLFVLVIDPLGAEPTRATSPSLEQRVDLAFRTEDGAVLRDQSQKKDEDAQDARKKVESARKTLDDAKKALDEACRNQNEILKATGVSPLEDCASPPRS